MKNYIEYLKEQVEEFENDLIELKDELAEKEGYQTLEDLGIEY